MRLVAIAKNWSRTYLVVPIFALTLCCISSSHTFARDSSGGCTIVSVGFYVQQIENVNVKEQTVDCEFYLWLKWKGAHSPENYEFVNGKDIQKLFEIRETDSLGQEFLSAKMRGTFRSDLDLSAFPIDSHVLHFGLEDFNWPEDSMRYSIDSANTGLSPGLSLGEWTIKENGPSLGSQYFAPTKGHFSHFGYSLVIERKPAPFVVKILIPLLIVVAMSMLTFFIPADALESQVGIGTTSLLTIVAFHFLIRDQLPEVGYLTKADMLMIGSYFVIFLALVESVSVNLLFRKGQMALAHTIDLWCRVLFPATYTAFLFILSLA